MKDVELDIKTRNGELRTLSYSGVIINIQGREIGVATAIDITDRKKAEEEHARLMSAIEQSKDVIIITDVEGNIQYANPAFELTTGWTRDEVLGKHTRIMKGGEQGDDFYKELWETIIKGDTWQEVFLNKRKDGSLYYEDARISPIINMEGEVTNFIGIKRDITEKLRLEEEKHKMEEVLIQNEKMLSLGGLAAGMAHEINNPIGAIIQIVQNIENRLGARGDSATNIKAAEGLGVCMKDIKNPTGDF
jgi:PAS domain S-box-containing protein